MTLSYGERLSSLIMTSVLKHHDINCLEALPENIGLLTDGVLGNARIEVNEVKDRVKAAFTEDSVYVVPGFYGVSSQGRITLLGRGGSDYTAAVIGRSLEAKSVDLWKDVSGFMSADPKLVVNTLPLHHLSYTEAAELSYFGARIIHPQTVEPLIDSNIPLRILSAGDYAGEITPATVIDAQVTQSEALIKSVTYSDDFAVLRLLGSGVGIKPGIMARVAGAFGEARVNIKSIITSQTCINILVATSDLGRGKEIIIGCGDVSIESINCLDDISVIAVVGEGILDSPGVAARVFSAVSNKGINVLMICMGAASVAAYFIVTRSDRTNAICAIHNEFFG
jgi:aspartokinase/homoserine dehydrogenase 1